MIVDSVAMKMYHSFLYMSMDCDHPRSPPGTTYPLDAETDWRLSPPSKSASRPDPSPSLMCSIWSDRLLVNLQRLT